MSDPHSHASDPRKAQRDVIATLFIVIAVPATVAWFTLSPGSRVPERCGSLFTRYLGLAVADRPTRGDRDELVANPRDPDGARRALDRCRASLTEREAACAEDARDIDAFERCFP